MKWSRRDHAIFWASLGFWAAMTPWEFLMRNDIAAVGVIGLLFWVHALWPEPRLPHTGGRYGYETGRTQC